MSVKSTFPNVKQPITDESGRPTKAHFDFLRTLWERTGGNNDNISDLEEEFNSADTLIFRNRIEKLERRIRALETQLDSLGC